MSADDINKKGSPFSDSVKLEARKLAAFRCCYCRDRAGDDVHHLLPQEDGGQGVIENAILLCVQCHAYYGHRSEKRKQLQQARDDWYEIVRDRQSVPDNQRLIAMFDDLATKKDFEALQIELNKTVDRLVIGFKQGSTSASEVANVGAVMVNSIPVNPAVGSLTLTGHPVTLAFNTICPRCRSKERTDAAFCSTCGARLGSST